MFFNRKLITLLVTSLFFERYNIFTVASASERKENVVQELECSCTFESLIGSDFSCYYISYDGTRWDFSCPSFGETGSDCVESSSPIASSTYNFVSEDNESADYSDGVIPLKFLMDPTIEVDDGVCFDAGPDPDSGDTANRWMIGCWACPTSPSPSVAPSNQPDENNDTDDDDVAEEDDECCCSCCEEKKVKNSLLWSIKNLFVVEN